MPVYLMDDLDGTGIETNVTRGNNPELASKKTYCYGLAFCL